MGKTMSALQWMDSTTTSKKIVLLIVMIGLVLCVFYVTKWEPTKTQMAVVSDDIQRLDEEILLIRNRMTKLAELQTEIEELERLLIKEGRISYQDAPGMRLRQKLVKVAENHQLDIILWRPVALVDEAKDGIREKSVEVRVEGGYHQVAHFFTHILHLPQILGISNLTMNVASDSTQKSLLKTDFILTSVELASDGVLSKVVRHQEKQAVRQIGS